jgi:hypothetical protein
MLQSVQLVQSEQSSSSMHPEMDTIIVRMNIKIIKRHISYFRFDIIISNLVD